MSHLWVKYEEDPPVRVSRKGCVYVADFINACHKKLFHKLAKWSRCALGLSLAADGEDLCPGVILDELAMQPGYVGNSRDHPLFIRVTK